MPEHDYEAHKKFWIDVEVHLADPTWVRPDNMYEANNDIGIWREIVSKRVRANTVTADFIRRKCIHLAALATHIAMTHGVIGETEIAMRRFVLNRSEDVTGVSGTGIVAEGTQFSCGRVAMMWLAEHRSIVYYDNIAAVIAIHGHEGKTVVEWLD